MGYPFYFPGDEQSSQEIDEKLFAGCTPQEKERWTEIGTIYGRTGLQQMAYEIRKHLRLMSKTRVQIQSRLIAEMGQCWMPLGRDPSIGRPRKNEDRDE
jgi:hypothetical protein